jgi:hypothetical protein
VNGFNETAPYRPVFDLLLRHSPRLTPGSALLHDGESIVEAAKRLVSALDGTALPIQGPPGAGKTSLPKKRDAERSHAFTRSRIGATIFPSGCAKRPVMKMPSIRSATVHVRFWPELPGCGHARTPLTR